MSDRSLAQLARKEFDQLRIRETVRRLRSPFKARKDRLLSLLEVKNILKPTAEAYQGIRSVPLKLIVGSEGRYNDFTRSFLPRHAKLRARWTRVFVAYSGNRYLPAVTLYELGGVYFIRDGNHRVSVAAGSGAEFIDAEVTSLGTYFKIEPGMTVVEMAAAVVEYERARFMSETHIDDLVPHLDLYFSSPGRYHVVLSHIISQREELGRRLDRQVPMAEAVRSWYSEVYEPVLQAIHDQGLLATFPERTASDLYVWIMDHGDLLKRKYGGGFPVAEVARRLASSSRAGRFPWLFGRKARKSREATAESAPDTEEGKEGRRQSR